MASRRCLKSLHRHYQSLCSSSSKTLPQNLNAALHTLPASPSLHQLENPTSNLPLISPNLQPQPLSFNQFESRRHFSSQRRNGGTHDDEGDEGDDDADEEDEDDEEEDDLSECSEGEEDSVSRPSGAVSRTYSVEEIAEEAAAIGYKVIGPLDPKERPFKHREPYFAVVQIGSHQFKVSNGDYIYTERLKFCEVNDKLILSKVLMVGSKTQTIIGRPILPEAIVHAVVEEHALDAKVIIFKKKRRKNYRRTKGHRQELTRLRITDIQGVDKPEKLAKPEKVEIAA